MHPILGGIEQMKNKRRPIKHQGSSIIEINLEAESVE